MKANSFTISEKVTGQERKVIAAVIAEALNVPVKYAGVPSFAYEAGGWSIDKNNNLKSPELLVEELQNLKPVLEVLKIAGIMAEGNTSVTISTEGYTESSLINLENLIKSKESLIKKALDVGVELSVAKNEKELVFDFYNATLNAEDIFSYITFSLKLSEQAKTLKYASPKEKETENDKYAFRCFLLRLGFIGDEYKVERKALLSRLDGNGAFRKKQ